MRIGHGYDVHQLISKEEFRKAFPERLSEGVILGGVLIPHDKVLLGHSDADVLIHAIMDAFLGAAALGDIGKHFPNTDPRYAGISSLELLSHVKTLISENYKIGNIDSTVLAENPKLSPYISEMRSKIASVLDIKLDQINIKATTTEGLGFVGRQEGIAAYAVVLLENRHPEPSEKA